MSATAKSFFNILKNRELVKPERIYHIKRTYEHVDTLFLYKKESLTAIIDEVLQTNPRDKIVVFCNSADRMLEMHDTYKEYADYYCSKDTKNRNLKSICDCDCIHTYDKNYITFQKRILFTTKALDNGIDLKDNAIKHIFSELFDLDCMVQALGRKRPLAGELDYCNFYIMVYSNKAINGYSNLTNAQLEPIQLLKKDEKAFINEYGNKRERLKKNKILYNCWDECIGDADNKKNTNGKVCINEQRYIKYLIDSVNINKMIENGYTSVICEWLGKELAEKIHLLDIKPQHNDVFLEFIKSVLNKPLYDNHQKELKAEFIKIGLKDTKMGIYTLNGRLQDDKYPYRIFNKDDSGKEYRDYIRKNPDGSDNIYYKKRYWIIKNYDWENNSYLLAN